MSAKEKHLDEDDSMGEVTSELQTNDATMETL
jgi:hypothetical protein